MPPVSEKQITVGASANVPTSLAFVFDVATTLTITGTIKDDNGNAIPYAGVSGRKVVSTLNTTAVGGDSGNFVEALLMLMAHILCMFLRVFG